MIVSSAKRFGCWAISKNESGVHVMSEGGARQRAGSTAPWFERGLFFPQLILVGCLALDGGSFVLDRALDRAGDRRDAGKVRLHRCKVRKAPH